MCLSDVLIRVEEIMDVFHIEVELGRGSLLFISTWYELFDPKENIIFSCISKQILKDNISLFFSLLNYLLNIKVMSEFSQICEFPSLLFTFLVGL